MQGNIYIRYSDLFDQPFSLATLKKELRQFKLSNVLFHVARMNVLLGRHRILRENREAMQDLQGQLIANYIDDQILEDKLKVKFGRFKMDEYAVFTRLQCLGLLRLIASESKESASITSEGKTPGGYSLGRCCLIMNDHLLSKKEEKAISEGTDLKRRKHLAIQLAPLLELYNPPAADRSVVRAEILFSELLKTKTMEAIRQRELRGFDISKAFLKATGIKLDTYRDFIVAIISWLYGHESAELIDKPNLFTFQRKQFIKNSKIKQRDFERYLSLDSITVPLLRGKFKTKQAKVLPHFDYVHFRRQPLIELDTGSFICADSCFAIEKLSSGIYWTIIDSLSGSDKQRAFDAFGYLFELYVNQILQRSQTSDTLFLPAPKYVNGENSVDGIILHGNQLILIEYKASFLRIEAKYGGKMRAFEKELDKKFGVDRDKGTDKGVAQLAKHIERLFHRKANARFHISALDELLLASHTRVEKVTPLLIVQEPFLRFHIIEDLLNVRFRKLLQKKKVSNAVTVGPLAVLDIDTLEQMKANIAGGDFTLAQCLNARAHRDPEYKQFWPEFISDHFEQFGKRDDIELNAKFSEIMDRTRKRFFGNGS